MTRNQDFISVIKKHQHTFHQVVEFDPVKDKILLMDFTENNRELTPELLGNTLQFSDYINFKLRTTSSKLAIGGYSEHRSVYSRSSLFNNSLPAYPSASSHKDEQAGHSLVQLEPRRLHLGTDIWAPPGTRVHAPLGGMVHSFAFNNHFGDYGVTIILLHQLNGLPFYTLYGHLSLRDIQNLKDGIFINRGNVLAHLGEPEENGHWPPHLHFQIILEMGMKEGDYPGVCKFSEKEKYLNNSPDPDLILQMNQYLK